MRLRLLLYNMQFALINFVSRFILRKRRLHCMGDSHVAVFKYIKENRPFELKNYFIETCIVPGATISGIENPNSKTKAKPIFEKYVKHNIKKGDTVLFLIGEVDCGFVIWYRAQNYNESVITNFNKAINNYRKFTQNLSHRINNDLIICDAPLPTISDNTDKGEVALLRKEINATQKERTKLTIDFNNSVKAMSEELKCGLIQTTDSLLDYNNGIIKRYYLNSNPLDHHLDQKKYAKLLISKLNQFEY